MLLAIELPGASTQALKIVPGCGRTGYLSPPTFEVQPTLQLTTDWAPDPDIPGYLGNWLGWQEFRKKGKKSRLYEEVD